ncbi:hypothetical protein AAMO2058_000210800 [Amorphochlora amoebiformis]|mmetsp:Transcript_24917/g.39361  ORF Transcript_24917/g.39361 Transcript_24917/m.39361 type:complete len:189 (-) Transcript_24917:563-1129(-)|eukprot:1393474-Amorphochlora_amoeboformis.AAC.1
MPSNMVSTSSQQAPPDVPPSRTIMPASGSPLLPVLTVTSSEGHVSALRNGRPRNSKSKRGQRKDKKRARKRKRDDKRTYKYKNAKKVFKLTVQESLPLDPRTCALVSRFAVSTQTTFGESTSSSPSPSSTSPSEEEKSLPRKKFKFWSSMREMAFTSASIALNAFGKAVGHAATKFVLEKVAEFAQIS